MKSNRAREQTRTEETIAQYMSRADSLFSRMAKEMRLSEDAYPPPGVMLAYMKEHAKEWKWSTFRQYQASLACRYELEYAKSHDPLFDKTATVIRDLSYQFCQSENTTKLRELLNNEIAPGHTEDNVFELCENTDKETVYIAFKPTDAYLQKVSNENELTFEERVKLNQDLYQGKFLPAFGDLATVDRSSFGFNVTNFGECYITVRITLGIEEPALLKAYAQQIIKLGAELHKNPSYVVPVPAHVPASA